MKRSQKVRRQKAVDMILDKTKEARRYSRDGRAKCWVRRGQDMMLISEEGWCYTFRDWEEMARWRDTDPEICEDLAKSVHAIVPAVPISALERLAMEAE